MNGFLDVMVRDVDIDNVFHDSTHLNFSKSIMIVGGKIAC